MHMDPKREFIVYIQKCVRSDRYRIRLHAVRHMVEEGFTEDHLYEALTGKLRILEVYPDDDRLLLLGYFHFSPLARSPLHVVCDISFEGMVDIVTAYIPQSPWWINATKRGKR